ncbi:MAG: hypothetical protein ACE5H9_05635 [Anaerolineae bacterium]
MPVHAMPLLFYATGAIALALLVWGFWRFRQPESGETLMGVRDDLLLWLSVLAAFVLGVFLTYILLGLRA